jgi:hypothetical protein
MCSGNGIQVSPSSVLACTLKRPECPSLAFAETSNADTYQPFFPFACGIVRFNDGCVLSLFHVDDPLTVRPLLDVAV